MRGGGIGWVKKIRLIESKVSTLDNNKGFINLRFQQKMNRQKTKWDQARFSSPVLRFGFASQLTLGPYPNLTSRSEMLFSSVTQPPATKKSVHTVHCAVISWLMKIGACGKRCPCGPFIMGSFATSASGSKALSAGCQCLRQLCFSKHRPSGPMLSISRNVCLSVCPSVRLFVCSLLRYRLNVFLPPLPEVGCPIFFRDSESLGKSNGKKWSQIWRFLFGSGLKLPRQKNLDFCWFCLTKHGGNHIFRWIRDLWWKGVSLILAYL